MKLLLLISLNILLLACSGDEGSPSQGAELSDSDVVYRVSFTTLWNETDHVSVPSNAHFSPVMIAVHNDTTRVFTTGARSSEGLERLAETGVTSTLRSELDQAIEDGSVLRYSEESDLFINSETVISFDLAISEDYPLVSLTSMIAPSPDWLVGVDSLALFNTNEGFIEDSGEILLYAYDAGTEEGDTAGNFSLGNPDTDPASIMTRLSGNGFDEPFARVRFVRE